VLVVDARRLQWRADPDERLRAVLTGAIQLVVVQERAAAAGISPAEFAELAAPVPIDNVRLGIAAGRSPDDEAAAYVMSILLLVALATYGQLVLTGVVQEKTSRVVEVLLARMPARTLLAGKIGGIGLLGFAQFAATALVALVATLAVGSADLPSVSGSVLAWVVVWFVLGYAMYAVAYGTFGSLASRTEDASNIAAPATVVLVVGYWAAFIAVSDDPEGAWARTASLFPATAPFAMPARSALGATAWWEPVVAVGLSLAAITGLAVVAGRVYSGAILHGGANLKLRDAWRRGAWVTSPPSAAGGAGPAAPGSGPSRAGGRPSPNASAVDRSTMAVLVGVAAASGVVVFALARDVIWAVAAAAASYAVGSRLLRARRHPAR
jgi:ABC-2 type transport system permease protein